MPTNSCIDCVNNKEIKTYKGEIKVGCLINGLHFKSCPDKCCCNYYKSKDK